MTRKEIIRSIQNVQNALFECGINKVFDQMPPGAPEYNVSLVESLKRYTILASKFSDHEKQLSKIFSLDELESTKLWETLITPLEKRDSPRRTRSRIPSYVLNFTRFSPKILKLFKQDDLEFFENTENKRPEKFKDKEILSIILHEEKNRISNPERLIEALESITLLYQACSIINDHNPDDLSVIAIDSGSDKSFDFLGIAKIIECTKDLIFDLWDRVIFHREKKMHERLDLIAKSLPIISKISELEESGALEPEQCEILRRNIFDGSKKFLSSGIIIPEMNDQSSFSPKKLLTPETKLLTTIAQSSEVEDATIESEEIDEINTENLSKEEEKLLKKLLKKKKKKEDEG